MATGYFKKHTHDVLYPDWEHWKPVFNGVYEISCLGRARRRQAGPGAQVGKVLRPTKTDDGYLYFIFCINGEYIRPVWVAPLVAGVFIGPCPDGQEVNHCDFDRENNRWDNLEYVTHAKNIEHSRVHGRYVGCSTGELNGNSKLTAKEVSMIRKLWAKGGLSKSAIGRQFGISHTMVRYIVTGHSWGS